MRGKLCQESFFPRMFFGAETTRMPPPTSQTHEREGEKEAVANFWNAYLFLPLPFCFPSFLFGGFRKCISLICSWGKKSLRQSCCKSYSLVVQSVFENFQILSSAIKKLLPGHHKRSPAQKNPSDIFPSNSIEISA